MEIQGFNKQAREPVLPSTPAVEVEYRSRAQLYEVIQQHRFEAINFHVKDVATMVAELRGESRNQVIQKAVNWWFAQATGFDVIEVECLEQEGTDDDKGALLLFRLKLDADHEVEVRSLQKGQDLQTRYRDLLVAALPTQLVARKEEKLKQMVMISWTKPGSVELGGVASMSLVVLIVMTLGFAACSCELCNCSPAVCACLSRRLEGNEYSCALRRLESRGAEFEVKADGSARLRVPAERPGKWKCYDSECLLM